MVMNREPLMSHKSRGFTLVELMVALLIGILLMGGLIQIFLANRASYRVMEGASFMQENMRFAVDRIANSMRMADHWGSVERSSITGGTTTTTVCTAAWARNLVFGVQALDGAATLPSALAGCASIPNPSANYQPNTDIVIIRYAGPDTIPLGTALTPTQYYLRTATAINRGALSVGSAVSTSSLPGARQYMIMPFNAEMFWVRRCSDPGADNNCGTADDGDAPIPIPTLMRSYLSADTWTTEPVAEGMEQLQLEYQIMNRPWTNATAVAAVVVPGGTPWDQISGVRIAGIMRSSQVETGFPADTRAFNLSGDTTSYAAPVAAQRYLRTAYEANVVMRSRVRPAPAL